MRRRPTRTRRACTALALAVLATCAPRAARAQDAVDLWAGWGAWSGKDAEGFGEGYALGATYVADIGWPIDLGLDVLFARFDYTLDTFEDVADEFQASLVLRRWLLGRQARVQPFVGARIGYTRLAQEAADRRLEQNGALAGAVLGVVLPSGRRLSPTLSIEAMRQRYDDVNVFLEGVELPSSSGSAWRFFVRAGITFGSGWKRRPR